MGPASSTRSICRQYVLAPNRQLNTWTHCKRCQFSSSVWGTRRLQQLASPCVQSDLNLLPSLPHHPMLSAHASFMAHGSCSCPATHIFLHGP